MTTPETKTLNSINFMSETEYESTTTDKSNLYAVETAVLTETDSYDLTTKDKTVLGALNELSEDKATVKLDNLNYVGNQKLMLSNLYPTGNCNTNPAGTAWIYRANDVFNREGFTVIGNPTITDGGIAGGFSSTAYLYRTFPESIDITNNVYKMKIMCIYKSGGHTGVLARFGRMWIADDTANGYIRLQAQASGGGNTNLARVSIPQLQDGDKLYITAWCGNPSTSQGITVSINGGEILNGIDAGGHINTTAPATTQLSIGTDYGNLPAYTGWLVDLKYTEIDINNIQVFSGLKQTSFDPEKFTVTGSPTIAVNGIASGFSAGNYITIPSSFLSADSWKIEYPISVTQTNQSGLFSVISVACMQIVYTPNGKTINYALSSSNSSWDIASGNFTAADLDNTKDSTFVIEYTGTAYNLSIIQGGTVVDGISIANSAKLYNSSNAIVLGANRSMNSFTNGTIDLKAIKVEANNQLVFQGIKDYVDQVAYDWIESQTYSLFDKSKFTVVGTPTITDSGIASGFSTNNYLTKSNAITVGASGEFHIDYEFTSASYTDIQYIFDIQNTVSNSIIFRRGANSNDYYILVFVGGTLVFNQGMTISSSDLSGYFEYKNGSYNWVLNGTTRTVAGTKLPAGIYTINIGVRDNSGTIQQPLVNGSFNLRQFLVTANDLPVFSGHETGIDSQVVPEYAKVGTPSISDAGYLSSGTTTDYVTIPNSVLRQIGTKTWELQWRGQLEVPGTAGKYVFGTDYTSTQSIINIGRFTATTGFYAEVITNPATPAPTALMQVTAADTTNPWYTGSLKFTGTQYVLTVTPDGGTALTSTINSTAVIAPQSFDQIIGFNHSAIIDLSSIKFIIADELAWQCALYIPYNRTSTGFKVVNSTYKAHVDDAYSQSNFSDYFLLDEANQRFTLPAGTLYGNLDNTCRDFDITIPKASWIGDEAPYTYTVPIQTLSGKDTPIVSLGSISDWTQLDTYGEEYGKIKRAVANLGRLKFYADAVPALDLPIHVKVVR